MAARLAHVGGHVVDTLRGFTWQKAWDTQSLTVLEAWFRAWTGPKVPLGATTAGLYTVASQASANGLVGRTVTGSVLITVSNVTLHDFKIVGDGSGNACLELSGALTGVVVQDFEVDGGGLITPSTAVGGSSFARCTMRRGYLHNSLDRFRAHEGSTYQHMYCVAPVVTADTGSAVHADAAQVVRASAPISITQSWLESTPSSGANVSSVIIVKTDAAAIDNVTVDSCYLNGGPYTAIVEAGAFGAPTNVSILNSRIGRDYAAGLWSGAGVDPATVTRTGNVWADTLTAVPLTWGHL